MLGPTAGRAPRWLSEGANVRHHTKDALAWVLGYFFRSVLSQLPPSQLRCHLPSVVHLYFPVKMGQTYPACYPFPDSEREEHSGGGESPPMTLTPSLPSASFWFC